MFSNFYITANDILSELDANASKKTNRFTLDLKLALATCPSQLPSRYDNHGCRGTEITFLLCFIQREGETSQGRAVHWKVNIFA